MSKLTVALAQIAPIVFDREACLAKIEGCVRSAAGQGARLVVFGEAVVPGYPLWLSRTGGARFDDPQQKAFQSRYADSAVSIERGDLASVQSAARETGAAVSLGERDSARAQHRGLGGRLLEEAARLEIPLLDEAAFVAKLAAEADDGGD